jgi:hypothetical protein
MTGPDKPAAGGGKVIDFAAHLEGGAALDPAFEARLVRALEVPVPEGLAERILLEQTTRTRRESRPALWRNWRAAALALAIGAGVALYGTSGPASALPELAVAHLSHEPFALSARARVAPSQLRALFASRGVRLAGDPEGVNYLMLCELDERTYAIHMVMQREEGPVTVYYVPGVREVERDDWRRKGMYGRSAPMGEGTLVLVSTSSASFDAIEMHWRELLEPRGVAGARHRIGYPVGH